MLRRISRFSPSLESRGKVISSMEKQVCPYPCLRLCELKSWERNKTKEFIRSFNKRKSGGDLGDICAGQRCWANSI